MPDTPSFKEDHISQIPAIQLLINLGYTYMPPAEATEARGGKAGNVILEKVLDGDGMTAADTGMSDFLQGGRIRGVTSQGEIFEHIISHKLTNAFLAGLAANEIRGTA